MSFRRSLLVAVLALLAPVPAMAQAASPQVDAQLQMERRQRRTIVRPSTPMEAVERDVDSAAADMEQQRQRETIREVTRPAPRRPDLDYDVKSGIQSQRLNDARRRR